MEKYEGALCPICKETITAEDDLVVCPDCGAPHHRACWAERKHCGCEHLHGTGRAWGDPEPVSEPEAENEAAADSAEENTTAEERVCPRCHTVNRSDAAFCSACGLPLMGYQTPPFYTPGQPGANGMPPGVHLMFDPLGGVPAEEEIEGVPARDLAEVVGRNSAYYIPRFYELSRRNRRFIPNFMAMLFDIPWFFFRKLYLPGIGVLILELAMMFPALWAAGNFLIHGGNVVFDDSFWTLNYICATLQLVVRLVAGLFANTIYMKQCASKAREWREKYPDPEEFKTVARKKGGVAQIFLYIWVILSAIYYLISGATGLLL